MKRHTPPATAGTQPLPDKLQLDGRDLTVEQGQQLTRIKSPFHTIPGIYEPNAFEWNTPGIVKQHYLNEMRRVKQLEPLACNTENPVRTLLKNCLVEAVRILYDQNKMEINPYAPVYARNSVLEKSFYHVVTKILESIQSLGVEDFMANLTPLQQKLERGSSLFPNHLGFFTGLADVLSCHRTNIHPTMVLTAMTDLPLDFLDKTIPSVKTSDLPITSFTEAFPPVSESASFRSATGALIERSAADVRRPLPAQRQSFDNL